MREWPSKEVTGDATNRTNPTMGLDAAHLGNWAGCIRDKDVKTPSPAPEALASVLLTHLANMAQRTGETVKVDPATGLLAKGSAGAELWAREYEKGWEMSV